MGADFDTNKFRRKPQARLAYVCDTGKSMKAEELYVRQKFVGVTSGA
jgi:hypothetical protein